MECANGCDPETLECREEYSCVERWVCTPWSDCEDGMRTRLCEDMNHCQTYDDKDVEAETCAISPPAPPEFPYYILIVVVVIIIIALAGIMFYYRQSAKPGTVKFKSRQKTYSK